MFFVCNHLRNLPFPASGNPSARFADANTNDGKRSLPRRFQMLFILFRTAYSHYSPMRNLPFPASENPSARFADANTNDGKHSLPRRFQILFVCNHLRNLPFPACGSPSARFADANTNDGKHSLPRRFRSGATKNAKPTPDVLASRFFGSPMRNRTADSAVRGQRLNRLTMRP